MLEGLARLSAILLMGVALGWELKAAAGGGQTMRIPFVPEAASCYRDVKKAPVLGPGFDEMLAAARREGDFAARLHEMQDLRMRLVKDYRAQPRPEAMQEESVFVCAANDLLEAMFSTEAEKLSSVPAKERASRADELVRLVRDIRLDPQWNDYTRNRIVERIRKQRGTGSSAGK